MAAPSVQTRQSPTGRKLENGHTAKIAFERDLNVNLWEIDVGQPGLEGGDPVDTTTQHNVTWRTMAPRTLITLTPFTIKFAYDPILRDEALTNLLNQPGAITIRYPDGSTLTFFGYMQTLEFDPLVEGEFPTGTMTVCPTNYDPVNDVEAAPVMALVSGT